MVDTICKSLVGLEKLVALFIMQYKYLVDTICKGLVGLEKPVALDLAEEKDQTKKKELLKQRKKVPVMNAFINLATCTYS